MQKMSKLLALIIVIILSTTSFSTIISGEEKPDDENVISIEYTFNEPQIEETHVYGFEFSKVSISGEANSCNPGEPVLPVGSAKILIPYDQEIDNIKILKSDEIEIPVDIYVEPGQYPVSLTDMPEPIDNTDEKNNQEGPEVISGDDINNDDATSGSQDTGGTDINQEQTPDTPETSNNSGSGGGGGTLSVSAIFQHVGRGRVSATVLANSINPGENNYSCGYTAKWAFYKKSLDEDAQWVHVGNSREYYIGSNGKYGTHFTYNLGPGESAEAKGVVSVKATDGRTGSATGTCQIGGTSLLYIDDVGFVSPAESIYGLNASYPGVDYEIVSIEKFRGYKIVHLRLYPVQYIPTLEGTIDKDGEKIFDFGGGSIGSGRPLDQENGILYYSSNLEVQVTTKREETSDDENFRGLQKDIDSVAGMIDNIVTLETYPGPFPTHTYEYIIITSTDFKNYDGEFNFSTLKYDHIARGLNAKIVTLDEIYNGVYFPVQGQDDAEKIRNFIKYAYNEWHTDYVLLGGDVEIVPIRKLFVYGENIPSDLYYSCLDGTFNADGDTIYGEINDGVDLTADVYVGRASVSNGQEIFNFVKKTLSYMYTKWGSDVEPISEYLNKALWLGEWLGPNWLIKWAGNYKDEIIDNSSANNYVTTGVPSDIFNVDYLYDRQWQQNGWPEPFINSAGRIDGGWPKSELIEKINENVHFINHLGHGDTRYAMKLSNSDLSHLTNNQFTFIYSQTCLAGALDIDDCFAEEITVGSDKGAFAVIMNSRYGWGSGVDTNGPSQHYDRQFWDAVFEENITALGEANADSKHDNIYRINEEYMRWCYYELNLFGDPAVRLKTSGDIYTEPINAAVAKPVLIQPENTINGINGNYIKLKAEVFDLNNDNMDVFFYNADNNNLIGKDRNVKSGDIASVYWFGIEHDTTYNWYAVANDSGYAEYEPYYEATSEVNSFTTIVDPDLPASSWWDENWEKRRPIMLWEDSDYITSKEGDTVLKMDIYIEDGMQDDFDDLRFVKYDDDATELVFWFDEEETNEIKTQAWIRLVDCSIYKTPRACIWMYYDNENAQSASNIDWFLEDEPAQLWGNVPPKHSENTGSRRSWAVKTVVDSENNIIVGGGRGPTICTRGNFRDPWYLVVKVDSDGNFLWDEEFTSDPDGGHKGSKKDDDDGDFLTGITVDSQDNIIVTGHSDDDGDAEGDNWPGALPHPGTGFGSGEVYAGYDFMTIKLDPDGNELWRRRIGGQNGRCAYWHITDPNWEPGDPVNENVAEVDFGIGPQYMNPKVVIDENDNIIVIGNRLTLGLHLYMVVYSPEGETLFEKLILSNDLHMIDHWGGGRVGISDMEIDEDGNIIIAGSKTVDRHMFGHPINSDAYVAKLTTTNEAGIKIENTVLNSSTGQWIDNLDLTSLEKLNGSGEIDLTFKLEVTNMGDVLLSNIQISYSLLDFLSYNGDVGVDSPHTIKSISESATSGKWGLTNLDGNQSAFLTFTATVDIDSLRQMQNNFCDLSKNKIKFSNDPMTHQTVVLVKTCNIQVNTSTVKGPLSVEDSADSILARTGIFPCGKPPQDSQDGYVTDYIEIPWNSNTAFTESGVMKQWITFLDGGFDTNLNNRDDHAYDIAIDNNGRIVVNTDFGIATLNPNGNIVSQKIESYPPKAIAKPGEELYYIEDQDPYCTSCDPEYIIYSDSLETVTFYGSESFDLDGEIVSYKWYLEDGTVICTEPDGSYVTPPKIDDCGIYYIYLEVVDDSGEKAGDSLKIQRFCSEMAVELPQPGESPPQNKHPTLTSIIASINDTYRAEIGEKILFNATVSFWYKEAPDQLNPIVFDYLKDRNNSCSWDFGDGNTGISQIRFSHEIIYGDSNKLIGKTQHVFVTQMEYEYGAKGFYEVAMSLLGALGIGEQIQIPNSPDNLPLATDKTIARIHGPDPEPPYVEIGGPYNGLCGGATQFNINEIYDLDGEIYYIKWDFGDGTSKEWDMSQGQTIFEGLNPFHVYLHEGVYDVSVTVKDDVGLNSGDSTTVSINGWQGRMDHIYSRHWGFSGGFVSIDSENHRILSGYRYLRPTNLHHYFSNQVFVEVESDYDVLTLTKIDEDVGFAHLTTNTEKGVFRNIVVVGYKGFGVCPINGGLYVSKYGYYNLSVDPDVNFLMGTEYTQDGSHEVPVLSYDPKNYNFGDMPEDQTAITTFDIWNSGFNNLEYSLKENCDWVAVSPTEGNSTGEHDTITITVNTKDLVEDLYTCDILIKTNNGEEIFTVELNVNESTVTPILDFNPLSYDFNFRPEGVTDSTSFEIWNDGPGTLHYSLSESCDWVEISPTDGQSSGEHDTINVNINTTGLPDGQYSCDISISSDGGNDNFTVEVEIVSGPVLWYSPESYDFGNMQINQTKESSFEIKNIGAGLLEYELETEYEWVSISPISGNCSSDEIDTISFGINTSTLSLGAHTCTILINSTGGNDTFIVTVNVVEIVPEITISKPKTGSMYLFDKESQFKPNFLGDRALILGSITITAETTGFTPDKVEFIVDGQIIGNATEEPFSIIYNEKIFGAVPLKVVAYDSSESEICSTQMDLIVINFGLTKK